MKISHITSFRRWFPPSREYPYEAVIYLHLTKEEYQAYNTGKMELLKNVLR